jgi:hypothetical protein
MYRKMTMLRSKAMRALAEMHDDPRRAGMIDLLDLCNREIEIARAAGGDEDDEA